MPSYSSKLQLSSTARSSNIVLADIDKIKGAFKVYTSTALNSESVNYFADGQIVYVEDSGSLYKANVSPADPPNTFVDSVIFTAFSFNSGSFVSASLTVPLTVVCARSRLMQNSPRTVSAVVNLFFFIIGCLKLLLVNRVIH